MFSVMLPPSYEDVRPFQWKGFQTGIHYTYLAKLGSETDLLSMYDPSLRRQIKKGEQQEHAFLMENSPEIAGGRLARLARHFRGTSLARRAA